MYIKMHPQVSTIKVQSYKEKNIKINHSIYHILYKKTYQNFHISVSKKGRTRKTKYCFNRRERNLYRKNSMPRRRD